MSTSITALNGFSDDLKFSGVEKFDVFEIIEKDATPTARDERAMTAKEVELPEAFFEYFVVQMAS